MANVLSLALRINADASGLKLDPVEKALSRLGEETTKVTRIFDRFTSTSEAAAKAQADTSKALQDLIEARRQGTVSAADFAKAFERIRDAATQESAALQRAAQITEANLTPLQRYDAALAELDEQLKAGRISQETYTRATEGAAKGLSDAERAARGLAVQQKQIETAAEKTTLKFNELSGVFSALPGPLGSIAGRVSGLSSASEGLARIFSGGLSQGVTNLGASVSALINPFTLAVGGIAAFGAAASAIASGLTALEDRVENLGNIADKLGVSFEFIQTLEESARRSGTSIDSVSAAFGRLQKSVLGVDEESKAAQKALSEIGVTAQELQSLAPEEQYRRIGSALAEIEDPARRTATATALFGRAGADLIPFFNNLPGAANDIERFGRVLTQLDRQRVDAFGAALDQLAVAGQGLGQSLLVPFAGLGEGIATALAEITAGITAIVDPIGRILEPVLTGIGRVIELIGTNVGNLGRVIGAVFEPFARLAESVSAALSPLLDAIFGFFENIGNAAATTTEWLVSFTPLGQITANVGKLGETVSRIVTIITTAFQRVGEFIGNLVGQFAELVAQSPLLSALGDTISAVFGSVASVFSTIADAVGGFVGRLLTIAENFLGIDRSAQQATEATAELGDQIQELTEDERRQAEERDKFLQGFTDRVSQAIDKSAQFGEAGFEAALKYQNGVAELQRQFDAGILNEQSFKTAVDAANESYEQQIDIIRRTAEEAERKAQAEQDAVQRIIDSNLEAIRVQQQFGGDSSRAKAAENLLRINDEFERVELRIRDARAAGDQGTIDALTARLGVLDQVAAREQDIATGALQARQAEAKAAADAAAAREQQEAQARQRRLAAEQEVERQIAGERQRVNQFVDQQVALAAFGGNQQRLEASRRVVEIEREIARVNADIDAARAAGNQQAVDAGVARIAQLDQVAAKERDIANGRAEIEKQLEERRRQSVEAQRQAAQQQQEAVRQQQQAAQQQAEAQRKAFEEQAAAAAAEAERQEARIRSLATVGQQTIQGGDIRSTEGARAFLSAAAGAFDPNLAELRAQTKLLQRIFINSGALQYLERGIGQSVAILRGGA